MKIILKGTNIDLTPSIKTFIDDKIGSLAKFMSDKEADLAEARVEIGKPSRHHRSGFVYMAEVNLRIGGRLLRAVTEHLDLHTAVDQARDELDRQLNKLKTKLRDVSRKPKRD